MKSTQKCFYALAVLIAILLVCAYFAARYQEPEKIYEETPDAIEGPSPRPINICKTEEGVPVPCKG